LRELAGLGRYDDRLRSRFVSDGFATGRDDVLFGEREMTRLNSFWVRFAFVAAIGGCLTAAGISADAPKVGDNVAETENQSKAGNDLSLAATAAQLAIEGENRESPLLLLAAAEILADLQQSRRDPSDVESSTTATDADGRLPALDMDALIARARELAKGHEALEAAVEAMIEGIESDSRGLVFRQGKDLETIELEGVIYKVINTEHDRLDPGDELTLENVIFEGQKPAQILVIGDGDGDLDLWVYDGNTGNEIASDTDLTSVCIADWTTRYEGPFTVKVKNVGTVWERFYVLANW
jgi:hypothetical protein